MSSQVLTHKWRPRCFEQVVGQAHVVRTLSNALTQQHLHHAYLFTGSRGVGKTTIARIIAKCFNCETGITATPCDQCSNCQEIDAGRFPDFFEIDAASRTKVEDTRELLDNVQYTPSKGRYKIYLIDEVHMLSGHSFNALLKTLEEPPEHVKFLLATTDPQKLPATVLSRCLQFHLTLMPAEQIAAHLQKVLSTEKIEFDQPATLLIAKAAQGSMRDALSLLDQSIAYGNGSVNEVDTKQMLGTIEPCMLYDCVQALADANADQLIQICRTLNEQGANFSQALADLLSILHQISLQQVLNDMLPADEAIVTLAKQLAAEDVQLYYQIALIGQRDILLAPTPLVGFEMTLLRMLAFTPDIPNNRNQQVTAALPAAKLTKTATSPKPSTTTAKNTKQSPIKNHVESGDCEQWYELFNKLGLTGAARALAEQCRLKSLTDSEIRLSLLYKHKAFLQDKQVQRIREAIKAVLQKQIDVIIEVEPAQTATETTLKNPAEISQQQQQQRLQAAEQRILNDEKVQRIMQAFDATLIKESIVPTDEH